MTEGASDPPFATALLFDYIALTNVLDRDVVASRTALLQVDSQFTRRQFVRAVAADIEATIGSMIRIALGVYRAEDEPFTPAEYALLQERVLELRQAGTAYEAAARLTTKTNIRFAFSVFARAIESHNSLPAQDSEWTALEQTLAIRDRITVPKSSLELDISDDELRVVHEADIWFDTHCAEALKTSRYEVRPERTA
jgi:hypothetical protein